jgi:hypothetical protein
MREAYQIEKRKAAWIGRFKPIYLLTALPFLHTQMGRWRSAQSLPFHTRDEPLPLRRGQREHRGI